MIKWIPLMVLATTWLGLITLSTVSAVKTNNTTQALNEIYVELIEQCLDQSNLKK